MENYDLINKAGKSVPLDVKDRFDVDYGQSTETQVSIGYYPDGAGVSPTRVDVPCIVFFSLGSSGYALTETGTLGYWSVNLE